MKVVQITTSSKGGAGIAALRLHNALQKQGVQSAYLSRNLSINFEGDIFEDSFFNYKKPSILKRIFIKITLFLFPSKLQKAQKNLNTIAPKMEFEMATIGFSSYALENHPLVKNADIVNLHWVGDFVNYYTFFQNCNKPIVWTLHDLNPFQGLFHYEGDYFRNKKIAGKLDIEQRQIKEKAMNQMNKGAIISPSNWLLEKAKKATAFREFQKFECITNAIDLDIFTVKDKFKVRKENEFSEDEFIMLFVSESKANYRKGADLLEAALEKFEIKCTLLVLGKGTVFINNSSIKVIPLGFVQDSTEIARYCTLADVFLVPSREDNLPNIILESFACGTPVIAFKTGGMQEHITDGITGVLANEINSVSLLKAIQKFYSEKSNFSPATIRKYAEKHFNFTKQAERYSAVYNKMIQ